MLPNAQIVAEVEVVARLEVIPEVDSEVEAVGSAEPQELGGVGVVGFSKLESP